MIKKLREAIVYCDDSSGDIGDAISDGIILLDQIAELEGIDKSAQILDFIETELDSNVYFDQGDFAYAMVGIANDVALKNHPERFIQLLDNLIQKKNGPRDDYEQSHFRMQKIDFLNALGRTAEAAQLTLESIYYSEIREIVVRQAITEKNFQKAKQLIVDGIEIARQNNQHGTVKKWEAMLRKMDVL